MSSGDRTMVHTRSVLLRILMLLAIVWLRILSSRSDGNLDTDASISASEV
jgi:hypothetical protein